MKTQQLAMSRDEFLALQVRRSAQKFSYCKVSISDVQKYRSIIGTSGPICCMGTRNGREVDLFRIAFYGSPIARMMSRLNEREVDGFSSRFPTVESLFRSDASNPDHKSVIGVEINPAAERRDVLIASFDDLSQYVASTFGIIFSNSFDHSLDPERTAAEWQRLLKRGGYYILQWADDAEPTETDPIGGITADDLCGLFKGNVVYRSTRGSRAGYHELIIRGR